MKTVDMKKISFTAYTVALLLIICSCKKDWLDVKNDAKVIVPTTLKDMRLLLNNTTVYQISYVGLGEIASDNILAQATQLSAASTTQQGAYSWAEDVFAGSEAVSEWEVCYNQIFTSNVVLEGLEKLNPNNNPAEWNDLKGAALFFRAKAFFDLTLLFTKPYEATTADKQLGIPLRLNAEITAPVTRATLNETYKQVTTDLLTAKNLLRNSNAYPTDASKPAALGLLARVYLAMGNFTEAKKCADGFLAINSTLIDYNTITATAARPFSRFNAETVFYSTLTNYNLFTNGFIDPALIASYHTNDIRLAAFFKPASGGLYNFKGNYSASAIPFSGFTPAELLLVRAECYARNNQLDLAMADMETLLKKRYKTGNYTKPTLTTTEQVLNYVLQERRKELIFRGIRWMDLRRLFTEPGLAVTVRHTVNGTTYELLPGSNRYAFAIPAYIISFSNLTQNPR